MHLIGRKRSPILTLIRLSIFLIRQLFNILCNFTPHETVLFDGRDPRWMNKKVKKLIYEKKNIFNCCRRSNNSKQLLDRLKDLQTQLNFFIEKSKGKFIYE